jgi:hypothetical protein
MPQTTQCKACLHPKRATIDKALVKGTPVARVARQYGLSEASMRRHVKHISAVVVKAKKQRDRRSIGHVLNVYDEFAADLVAINKEIAEEKDPEIRQGWYLIKGKRLETAIKSGLLRELLGGARGNGKAVHPVDEALPESVQRVIDAVVTNDE